MRAHRWTAGAVAGLAALALAACGQPQPPGNGEAAGSQEGLQVVATTSILGDITRNVVGDAGAVEVLMPPGTDPHSFEPSAQQVAALREADVVVANGLQLVESLVDDLQAAEQSGTAVVRVAEQLNPIPYEGSVEHGHEEEGAHAGEEEGAHAEEGALDPHVWFDPVRMADGVRLIANQIATTAPQSAEAVRANASRYAQELLATHERVEQILAAVPPDQRKLVTNHDALGYFAERYGFEVIGTVIPGGSTQAEPSAAELAELVATIKETQAPAIFVENVASPRLAEAVTREVGSEVQVVQLFTDALAEQGEASTYLGLLRVDAQRIADALTTAP